VEKINSVMSLPSYPIARNGKTIDIRAMIKMAEMNNSSLRIVLSDIDGNKVRLYEALRELFYESEEKLKTIPIKRLCLYGYDRQKGWIEPMENKKI